VSLSNELVPLATKAEQNVAVMMRRAFVCPTAGCGCVVSASANSGYVCGRCERLACDACYQPLDASHTRAVCAANQDKAARAKYDELRAAMPADVHTRCCGACLQPIQRGEGCNTVQCTACQTYSCWQCGTVLVNTDELEACYVKNNGLTMTPNFVAHRHFDEDDDVITHMPQRLQDLVNTRRNGGRCQLNGKLNVAPELRLDDVRRIMFPKPPVEDP
jgi:hypothetical protein